MKPHTLSPFFFIGFQTAANRLSPVQVIVFFNEPVHAARPSEVLFSCGSLASKKKISRRRRCAQRDQECMATWEKSEFRNVSTTSKQPTRTLTPKHSRPPLIRGRWGWNTDKLSLGRGNTYKLTAAQRMANHYSEELQRTTAGRMSKQSSAPTGHCTTRTGAKTTQAFFFVDGTHVHWQTTAEQFFFSEFNMHLMFRKASLEGMCCVWLCKSLFWQCCLGRIFIRFFSLVLSLRLTLFWSPSVALSFFFFAYCNPGNFRKRLFFVLFVSFWNLWKVIALILINFTWLKCTVKRSQLWKLVAFERPKSPLD